MKEFLKCIESHYDYIFIGLGYVMLIYIIVETYCIVAKGKMIIDYILDWQERRKK